MLTVKSSVSDADVQSPVLSHERMRNCQHVEHPNSNGICNTWNNSLNLRLSERRVFEDGLALQRFDNRLRHVTLLRLRREADDPFADSLVYLLECCLTRDKRQRWLRLPADGFRVFADRQVCLRQADRNDGRMQQRFVQKDTGCLNERNLNTGA